MYTYCHNNPIVYDDPTGHKAKGLFASGKEKLQSGWNSFKNGAKIARNNAINAKLNGAGTGLASNSHGANGFIIDLQRFGSKGVKGISNPQKKLITGEDWHSYFKETYGSQNVRWESAVNSIDEIIDTPSLVTRMQPEQMAELAQKSGWNVGPLKNGRSSGIPFESGGGISMNRMVD